MSQREKKFQRWISNPPTEVPFDPFKAMVKEYGLELSNPTGGSHYTIYHIKWEDFQRESHNPSLKIVNNTFSVPVHQKKIKKRYFLIVLKFIDFLQETENVEEE